MGGTYDDNVRHAITALSSVFITTNKKASNYLSIIILILEGF